MNELADGGVTKAQAVNGAVRQLFTRFNRSRFARNFSFAVVTFDEHALLHTPVTAAAEVDGDGNYDPLGNHGGATDIGSGLQEAKRIAADFLLKSSPTISTTVTIVLMSDGLEGEGGLGGTEETRCIAEEIKRNPATSICSAYFATCGKSDAQAQEFLKCLASDPVSNYRTVTDAEDLRTFFIKSVSTNTSIDFQ